MVSMSGEEMERTLMFFIWFLVYRSFSCRNLSLSYPSIENALTILIPPMASCRREVMSPMDICPLVDMFFIFLPSLRIG